MSRLFFIQLDTGVDFDQFLQRDLLFRGRAVFMAHLRHLLGDAQAIFPHFLDLRHCRPLRRNGVRMCLGIGGARQGTVMLFRRQTSGGGDEILHFEAALGRIIGLNDCRD